MYLDRLPIPAGGCTCCQLRKAEIEQYARKRLEGKHGVPPRMAVSDMGPRVPLFDVSLCFITWFKSLLSGFCEGKA